MQFYSRSVEDIADCFCQEEARGVEKRKEEKKTALKERQQWECDGEKTAAQ